MRPRFNIVALRLMSSHFIPPSPGNTEPDSVPRLLANSGQARLVKVLAGVFLAAGMLGLADRAWFFSADLHARHTWPTAQGEIVSANQTDDDEQPSFKVSIRDRKRYWVEYEVRFALAEQQCRTGIYAGSAEPMGCRGMVRTRSTQSSHQAYGWLLHGYHVNQPVTILYSPDSSQIKIAGEPIWLRYNLERLILNALWVLVFSGVYAFANRREAYLRCHPEAETLTKEPDCRADDRYKLTDLGLS